MEGSTALTRSSGPCMPTGLPALGGDVSSQGSRSRDGRGPHCAGPFGGEIQSRVKKFLADLTMTESWLPSKFTDLSSIDDETGTGDGWFDCTDKKQLPCALCPGQQGLLFLGGDVEFIKKSIVVREVHTVSGHVAIDKACEGCDVIPKWNASWCCDQREGVALSGHVPWPTGLHLHCRARHKKDN